MCVTFQSHLSAEYLFGPVLEQKTDKVLWVFECLPLTAEAISYKMSAPKPNFTSFYLS